MVVTEPLPQQSDGSVGLALHAPAAVPAGAEGFPREEQTGGLDR